VAHQADLNGQNQVEKIQTAINKILEAANFASSLGEFFGIVHHVVNELMVAKNFYIALYEPTVKTLEFSYFVDEYNQPLVGPQPLGKGLTEYVLRTEEPLLATPGVFAALVEAGEVEPVGYPCVDWLGVPLKTKDQIIGVMVVQTYTELDRLGSEESEILKLISNQVALTIERNQAQDKLRESEVFYKTLFDNAPVILFSKNREGRYTSANAETLKYWTPLNPIGFTDADLLDPEIAAELRRNDVRVMETGQEMFLEENFITLEGRRTVLSRKVPLRNAAGSIAGVLGISVDITERKRAEAELHQAKETAETANRAKSQFLANMSHELRTPLNAIIGYSEMLREEAEDLGLQTFLPDLDKIRTAGQHLLSLISSILDLSKIEAGKMDLFLETFDVLSMVREVVDTIQPLVEKNANTLEFHYADNLGSMVADLTKTRQTLFNLLSNACKFTENGKITLTVERKGRPEETLEADRQNGSDQIIFRVSDTGIGMSAEQLESLFEPFTQADASTTRKYGGTGLGLAISQRFCQMMGGYVSAESELNSGTTFIIHLPSRVPDPNTGQAITGGMASISPEETPAMIDGYNTVLVIDDDPIAQDLLKRHLIKEGFQVQTASDGETGLRLAKMLHPVAITLDVMMPGMDGWAVLARLKAEPELADIPVIMLTIVNDKNMGYTLGASDYLTKPIERDRLLSVVRKYRADRSRCLLVEDDPVIRDLVRRTLEKAGWHVSEAENGLVALELVAENKPEVILLDLMMPEMDGFQFIAELRKTPAWRTIPVIVITAMDLTPEDHLRLNGYVIQILQKGAYSRAELLQEIQALMMSNIHAKRAFPKDT
jgi:PAS domain S-box-containing protein